MGEPINLEAFQRFLKERDSKQKKPIVPPNLPPTRFHQHPTVRIIQKQIIEHLDNKYMHLYSPTQDTTGSNWNTPDEHSPFWNDIKNHLRTMIKNNPAVLEIMDFSINHDYYRTGYIELDLKCFLDDRSVQEFEGWLYNPDASRKKRSE